MSTPGIGNTPTGRPHQALPLSVRFLLLVGALVAFLEMVLDVTERMPKLWGWLRNQLAPVLNVYVPVRTWALAHPVLAALVGITLVIGLILLNRWLLLFWHNEVASRLLGTRFSAQDERFPMLKVDVLQAITRRPPGQYFVGMKPVRGVLGWRARPVYISQRQKTMHSHVLGKTGSGKTQSVLWPGILQDLLDGKGVVVMSGKGSDEEIRTIKALAAMARRPHERD